MHHLQFQRGLILGHVELLEPTWKADPGPMRIFTAPLSTEVEVARNMHELVRVLGPGKGKDVKVCDRPRATPQPSQTVVAWEACSTAAMSSNRHQGA